MPYQVKDLPWAKDALEGISSRTVEVHHDRLYAGYVNKRNEVEEALKTADRSRAAQQYSAYRALKLEETFNADGQILHELYFDTLGGKGQQPRGALIAKINEDFGSLEAFLEDLRACAMAARGWAVMSYDPSDGKLHNYLCDVHNQGGVWGAIPIFTIDSYEHAYFMDYGSDRGAYITALLRNVNWDEVERRYLLIKA